MKERLQCNIGPGVLSAVVQWIGNMGPLGVSVAWLAIVVRDHWVADTGGALVL